MTDDKVEVSPPSTLPPTPGAGPGPGPGLGQPPAPVRFRLRTGDHSRGFPLDPGTVIGDGTEYPLIEGDPSRDMIPLTPTAQALWDEKDKRKGWSLGKL